MERKKASDYPQELLDLFHEYQHGDISHREFLDRAGKFPTAGVTAVALWESLKPNYAWAQQVPKDDARIKTEYLTYPSPEGSGTMRGYFARPASARHPRTTSSGSLTSRRRTSTRSPKCSRRKAWRQRAC